MQEQGFSIQIGFNFYRSFSIPQISHSGGNGGKRASFQIKLNGTEPPPKHRQLVSIVYTYKDGTVEKLFGGEVGAIQLLPEFFPYRVYQITCRDFESIFLNVEPFSYRQLFPQPITVHALALLALGGGLSATQQPNGDTRSRLNLVIRQSSEPPPWVDTTNANEDLQPFAVENSTLGQAIQKLCNQFGFSYSVDFGTWLRIDLLGNNPLANLILTRNDFGQTNERLLIDTSPDSDPCLQTKYSNLKLQFQARDINRVLVAKDPESLLNRNVPQMDTINNFLIPANSPENSINLLKKTGTVKSYFITTDNFGGDGGGSGGGDAS
jgi:hypothetical protein